MAVGSNGSIRPDHRHHHEHRRRPSGEFRHALEEKAEEKLNAVRAHTPTIVYNAGRPAARRASSRPAIADRQLIAVDAEPNCDLDGLPYSDDPASRANAALRARPCTARWATTRRKSGGGLPLGCKASPCGSSSRTASTAAKSSTTRYNSDINSLGHRAAIPVGNERKPR